MKRSAKIRFLAWLMVVCLLVPDLSLDAFAANLATDKSVDSTMVEGNDGTVVDDDIANNVNATFVKNLYLSDVTCIPALDSVVVKGKVTGWSQHDFENINVYAGNLNGNTYVDATACDFTRSDEFYYNYNTDFTVQIKGLESATSYPITYNGEKIATVTTLTEDDRAVKVDGICAQSGNVVIKYSITGAAAKSAEANYLDVFVREVKEGNTDKWFTDDQDYYSDIYENASCEYDVDKDVTTGVVEINGLDSTKEYEYVIGLGGQYYPYYSDWKDNVPGGANFAGNYKNTVTAKFKAANTENAFVVDIVKNTEKVGVHRYRANVKVTGDATYFDTPKSAIYKYDAEAKLYNRINVYNGEGFEIDERGLDAETKYNYLIATVSSNSTVSYNGTLPNSVAEVKVLTDNKAVVKEISFTTLKDDRKVDLLDKYAESDYNSITIPASLIATKAVYDELDALQTYFYVKSSSDKDWSCKDQRRIFRYDVVTINSLNASTTYTVKAVAVNNTDDYAEYYDVETGALKSNLTDAQKTAAAKVIMSTDEATVSTKVDDRTIKILTGEENGEKIGCYTYNSKYVITGIAVNDGERSNIAMLIKDAKGNIVGNKTDSSTIGNSFGFAGLDAASAYTVEVAIIKDASKPFEYAEDGKITGFGKDNVVKSDSRSFTTLKEDRTPVFYVMDEGCNAVKANVGVTGTAAKTESIANLYVFYKEANAKEDVAYSRINVEAINDSLKEVIFTGLKPSTKYECNVILVKSRNDQYFDSKTGKLMSDEEIKKINPDITEEELKNIKANVIGSTTGTFTTIADDRRPVIASENIGLTRYAAEFGVEGIATKHEFVGNNLFAFYYKKSTDKDYNFVTNDDYVYLVGLDRATSYDYKLLLLGDYETDENGEYKNVISTLTGKFTTLSEDRSIYVDKESAKVYSYSADIIVEGEVAKETDSVIYYYYKKSSDKWTAEDKVNAYNFVSEAGDRTRTNITNEPLEASTSYDYIILLCDGYVSDIKIADDGKVTVAEDDAARVINLSKPYTGKFETKADDRKPVLKEQKVSRTAAKLTFDLEGDALEYDKSDAYLFFYYKAEADKEWTEGCPISRTWSWDADNKEGVMEDISLDALTPSTKYVYKIGVSTNAISETEGAPEKDTELLAAHTITGDFTTAADNRKIVITEDAKRIADVKTDSVKLRYYISNLDEELDFKNIFTGEDIENPGCEVLVEYKLATDKDFIEYGRFPYNYNNPLNLDGNGNDFIVINNLQSGKEYEFKVSIVDSSVTSEIKKITTLTDDRKLSLKEANLNPYNFQVTMALSGKAAIEETTYWTFVYKDEFGDWYVEESITNGVDAPADFEKTFEIPFSDEIKKYEYKVAVSGKRIDPATLEAVTASTDTVYVGSFTVPAETRKISGVTLRTGYTNATVTASIENVNTVKTDAVIWYKAKESYDWKPSVALINNDSEKYRASIVSTRVLTGLEQGKEYDYVIAIYKNNKVSFVNPNNAAFNDDVVDTYVGSFATKVSDFTATVSENNITYNTMDLDVTLSSKIDTTSMIVANVTIKAQNSNDTINATTVIAAAGARKNTVHFVGLDPDTVYDVQSIKLSTYQFTNTAGLGSLVVIDVLEDRTESFKTLAAKTTSIKLVTSFDSEVKLDDKNVAKLNKFDDNFNFINVIVEAPEGEANDVYWTVSNNSLGTVYYYGTDTNMVVWADSDSKPGTGVLITAVSKYNPNAKASFTVDVADIRLFGIDAEGKEKVVLSYDPDNGFYDDAVQKIYKGVASEYKLYDFSTAKKVCVSVSDNSIDRANVLTVENTNPIKVAGVNTGYATVTLDYAGFKTAFKAKVKAQAIGVALRGLEANEDYYSAIENKDGSFKIAKASGVTYKVNLIKTPDKDFEEVDNTDFFWKSSDDTILKVSKDGVLRPVKADVDTTVTITCTPKDEDMQAISFDVKVYPTPNYPSVSYVYANLKMKKLADVPFNGGSIGWTWSQPNTSLASLEVGNSYSFDAEYVGETYFPVKSSVTVHYGVIKKLYSWDDGYNHVLEKSTDGHDVVMPLHFSYESLGETDGSHFNVVIKPVKNLKIDRINDYNFNISSAKAGKYTITAELYHKATSTKIATCKYVLTVVDADQVMSIDVEAFDGDILMGGSYHDGRSAKNIICDVDNMKNYTLKATAYDVYGEKLDGVKFSWAINDKKVAKLGKAKGVAETSLKALKEGNATITVKATDKRGKVTTIALQVRNYTPDIEYTAKGNVVKVNTALDYYSVKGKEIARAKGGMFKIIPSYAYERDVITSVVLYEDAELKNVAKDLVVVKNAGSDSNGVNTPYEYDEYMVYPRYTAYDGSANTIADGKKNYFLKISTKMNNGTELKAVPLTVEVKKELPKIKAKSSKKLNLFYSQDYGTVKFTFKGVDTTVKTVVWDDGNALVSGNNNVKTVSDNNFYMVAQANNEANIYQDNVKVKTKGKKMVLDGTAINGKIKVLLDGYKDTVEISKFKIASVYKKPKLQTKFFGKNKSICTVLGMNSQMFYIYDKLIKSAYYYDSDFDMYAEAYDELDNTFNAFDGKNIYNMISDSNDKMVVEPSDDASSAIAVFGAGKTVLTLDSMFWRTNNTAKLSIKDIKPKAVLDSSKLVFNTKYSSVLTDGIYIKNVGALYIPMSGIEVKALKSASGLVSQNALEICMNPYGNAIEITKNHAANALAIKNGKYNFQIIPAVAVSKFDAEGKETVSNVKLNTLKLSVAVTDKKPQLSAKVSGKLNILKSNSYSNQYNSNDAATYSDMTIAYKWTGVPSGAYASVPDLDGAYSDYFTLRDCPIDRKIHVFINEYRHNNSDKIKAGFVYIMNAVGNVYFASGESIAVESKSIKIKPIQKTPKVKLAKKLLYVYTSNDSHQDVTDITLESGFAANNTEWVDVNKDGVADFRCTVNINNNGTGTIAVNLANVNGIVADKTYAVPMTVRLYGRDGIAKDLVIKAKVRVNR